MPERKKKILNYQRADWLEDLPVNVTFETYLRQALGKLSTVGQTAVGRDNGQVLSCATRDVKPKGGVYLHVTAVAPGEEASVVSNEVDEVETIDVDTVKAPDGNDFVDGDVLIFVRKNNVCVCSTDIHDGTLSYYFHQLLSKARIGEKATKFLLRAVADLEKIKFLREHPVHSVTLNASLFEASANRVRDAKRAKGVAAIVGKFLNAFVGREHDVSHDSLMVELTLKTDGRVKQHISIGEQKLEDFAIDLVKNQDHSDNFVIITRDKQRITANELKVRRVIEIETKGKSVDRDEAWKELLHFYNELVEMGATED